MKKILLIIKREYLTRVRKRSFIVMTFLTPILMVGIMSLVVFLSIEDNKKYEVLIADFDSVISAKPGPQAHYESRFPNRFKDSSDIEYTFTRDTLSKDKFEDSKYDILIEFDKEVIQGQAVDLYYKDYPGALAKERIKGELENTIEEYKVKEETSLSYEAYKKLKTPIKLLEKDIARVGEEDQIQNMELRVGIGFAFALVIYLFIFIYGMQVMRGVIEEKTNRVIEVLISSVKPFQLMLGKILGIAMVGLTQILMWIALVGILSSVLMFVASQSMPSPSELIEANAGMVNTGGFDFEALMNGDEAQTIMSINWPLQIGCFIFFFLAGFLLYAAMFAAIGAAVDNETDTQQFMIPVSLPLVVGFLISELLILNPGGAVAKIFSLIPLTSPVVMMPMVSMGTIEREPWILIVSILLLIGFFFFVVWLAGRIYRVGILMYGKKASYRELWKWLSYKE